MVALDSNHIHEYVLAELWAYAPLVKKGGYCVVSNTIIDDMPKGSFPSLLWDVRNNPKSTVYAYLDEITNFEIDRDIDNKLLISVAPNGYLKRIS